MHLFYVLAALFLLVAAQTQTIVDPAGETVVVALTLGPNGLPTTLTLQTLRTTTTSTTSPAAVTTAPPQPVQQGPVGQPGPTGPAGAATPFTYTTVINGVTQVTTDVFTPTAPTTIPTTAPATGTILDFSVWLTQYGGGVQQPFPSSASPTIPRLGWIVIPSLLSAVVALYL